MARRARQSLRTRCARSEVCSMRRCVRLGMEARVAGAVRRMTRAACDRSIGIGVTRRARGRAGRGERRGRRLARRAVVTSAACIIVVCGEHRTVALRVEEAAVASLRARIREGTRMHAGPGARSAGESPSTEGVTFVDREKARVIRTVERGGDRRFGADGGLAFVRAADGRDEAVGAPARRGRRSCVAPGAPFAEQVADAVAIRRRIRELRLRRACDHERESQARGAESCSATSNIAHHLELKRMARQVQGPAPKWRYVEAQRAC